MSIYELLNILIGLATAPIAPDLSGTGWTYPSSEGWVNEGVGLRLTMESKSVVESCKAQPDRYLVTPLSIEGTEQVHLDGVMIASAGDPSYQTAFPIYGFLAVPCSTIAQGSLVRFSVYTEVKLLAFVSDAPRVDTFPYGRKIFTTLIYLMSAGALALMGVLFFALFYGKIKTPVLIAFCLGAFSTSLGLLLYVPDLIHLPGTFRTTVKLSDISLWLGILLMTRIISISPGYPKFFDRLLMVTSVLGISIIAISRTMDQGQVGVNIAIVGGNAFIIALLFHSLVRTVQNPRDYAVISQTLALLTFCVTGIHDSLMFLGLFGGLSIPLFALGLTAFSCFLGFSALERINQTYRELERLKLHLEDEVRTKTEALSKVATFAAQVSHDIRSPLATLNSIALHELDLSDSTARIFKRAVDRVRDISDQFLTRYRSGTTTENAPAETLARANRDSVLESSRRELVWIAKRLDEVVSQISLQIKNNPQVAIITDFSKAYDSFCEVDPTVFDRAIANLLNNALESIPAEKSGKIQVIVDSSPESRVIISIIDNGVSIDTHLMSRVGDIGVTHGKSEGTGLGLSYAKSAVSSWRGSFVLNSKKGQGTTVAIELKKSSPPIWFLKSLPLKPGTLLVVLDDDPTVADLWRRLVAKSNVPDVRIQSFLSETDLRAWYSETLGGTSEDILFLVDHDLGVGVRNGIDVIDLLGVSANSILVSDRADEPEILGRCLKLGVKVLPKMFVGRDVGF